MAFNAIKAINSFANNSYSLQFLRVQHKVGESPLTFDPQDKRSRSCLINCTSSITSYYNNFSPYSKDSLK